MIAWSQNLTPERAAEAGARAVSKDELFAAADVLTVHLMLSERTPAWSAERELRAMKPTRVPGQHLAGADHRRGGAAAGAPRGWIAGAGLDVYDAEPLPADDPLRHAPRTVLTPHLGYVTERTTGYWYERRGRGHRGLAAGKARPAADPGLSPAGPGQAGPGPTGPDPGGPGVQLPARPRPWRNQCPRRGVHPVWLKGTRYHDPGDRARRRHPRRREDRRDRPAGPAGRDRLADPVLPAPRGRAHRPAAGH